MVQHLSFVCRVPPLPCSVQPGQRKHPPGSASRFCRFRMRTSSEVRVLTTAPRTLLFCQDQLQDGKAILRPVDGLVHAGQRLESASARNPLSGLTSRWKMASCCRRRLRLAGVSQARTWPWLMIATRSHKLVGLHHVMGGQQQGAGGIVDRSSCAQSGAHREKRPHPTPGSAHPGRAHRDRSESRARYSSSGADRWRDRMIWC